MVDTTAQDLTAPATLAGQTIYLDRCIGGCAINPGANDDATQDTPISQIVNQPSVLPEFTFQPGDWEAAVQCVKEVYSPFDVNIVDVRPPAGTVYSRIMVGGSGADVGHAGAGGVASLSQSCTPIQKGVSFAFTDQLDAFAAEVGGNRAFGLCWIIAQETAHNWSLDHEFEFTDDKTSACNDPMTYRFDCGGQKFFRNKFAVCGEFEEMGPRACRCGGGTQNSHLRLTGFFGENPREPLIAPPDTIVTTPAASSAAADSFPTQIIASAGSKRGVNRVELFLNGRKFASVPGAKFGQRGQVNPSTYVLPPPANLPNSIYDIEVRAYDDLEAVGTSQIITVTKGPAGGCASADTCLEGQKCEAGKCFWDPATGNVGDSCSFNEFCLSNICSDSLINDPNAICSQNCVVGTADSCPEGLTCIEGANICFFPPDEGGCCSSGRGTPWAPFGMAGVVLGLIVIRRRRR